jgi:hypothetical protein
VPLWLFIGFVFVLVLIVWELFAGVLRPRRRVIVLDSWWRIQRKAWPLRMLALLSATVAGIVHKGYGSARPNLLIDGITTACLIISLVLVVLLWRLAGTGRLKP